MTVTQIKALDLANAFGFMTKAEVAALYAFACSVPDNQAIITIGAGAGTSSLTIVEARQETNGHERTYTIDISEGGPLGGLENERNAFTAADLIDKLPHQILGDSKYVASKFREHYSGEIGLIFIDGDHSPEGIIGDIAGYAPLLAVGGFLAVHDYGRAEWPAVRVHVDRMLIEWPVMLTVNTLQILRRPLPKSGRKKRGAV